MAEHHIVRIGAMGRIEPVAAAQRVRYPRGSDVIVRTPRGLEVAIVLALPEAGSEAAASQSTIIRAMTDQDFLLQRRLETNRHDAFHSCCAKLAELSVPATLVDVEHLFDGQSLLFYFLGDIPPEVEAYTQELAEAYEARAQFRRFTDALEAGCGPDCGTDAATGCGSCGTGCALAAHCSDRV